jgi:hypothetical protein
MLLLEALEQFGPVGVFPVKTRIIFQAEVQFAAAMPHKRWLRRPTGHPKIRKVEMGIFRDCDHLFRLTRPEDLDKGLIDLLHEAYIAGCEI